MSVFSESSRAHRRDAHRSKNTRSEKQLKALGSATNYGFSTILLSNA